MASICKLVRLSFSSIPELKESGYYSEIATIRKDFADAKKLVKTDPEKGIEKLKDVKKSLQTLKKVVQTIPDDSTGTKVLSFIARDIVGSAVGTILLRAVAPHIPVSAILTLKSGLQGAIMGGNVVAAFQTPKQAMKSIDTMIGNIDRIIARAKIKNAEESNLETGNEAFGAAKYAANMKDMDVITAYVKSIAGQIKADGDTIAKMKAAVSQYNSQYGATTGMKLAMKTVAGVPVILSKQGNEIKEIQYGTGGPKFKAMSMSRMRAAVGKGMKKEAKAAKKAGASESFLFEDFANACESAMSSTETGSWSDAFFD